MAVSPLWQSLTVGGTYSGMDGSYSLNLEKQSDGRTWQSAETAYLLPSSSSPASITVRITTPSGTRSYTYSTSDQLEAGYKIDIEGTYTEAVGVTLSGTIEGATWLGERIIRFDFDESGSNSSGTTEEGDDNEGNDENEGGGVSELPAVGTLYQGCYVLTGNGTTATLLSPNETAIGKARSQFFNEEEMTEAIGSIIESMAVEGIGGWRLPTLAELSAIYSASDTANALFGAEGGTSLTAARRYLYTAGDGNVLARTLSTPDIPGADNFQANAYVRPVAIITKQ
mgnify:CR=1 FL=1